MRPIGISPGVIDKMRHGTPTHIVSPFVYLLHDSDVGSFPLGLLRSLSSKVADSESLRSNNIEFESHLSGRRGTNREAGIGFADGVLQRRLATIWGGLSLRGAGEEIG